MPPIGTKAIFLCLLIVTAAAGARPEPTGPAPDPAGPLAIIHVSVVPMDRETIHDDFTVLVEGGRITAVGPDGSIPVPDRAQVVDGTNRWLMPGLVDTHVHVDDAGDLLLYLANGVTTVVNLKGAPEHLALRRALTAGQRVGPRLLSCGPFIRGERVTAKEIPQRVQEIADAGYDCVKIYTPGWTEEKYDAVARAARQSDILFLGHAPRGIGLEPVIRHGRQRVVHLEEVVYATPALDGWIEAAKQADSDTQPELEPELRGVADDLAQRLADAGIWIAATQIVIENYLDRSNPEGLERLASLPLMAYLDPLNRHWWATRSATGLARFRHQVALQHYLLRAFREHGVPMALGTDADTTSDLLVMPGWSVHQELEILVEAGGFSPYQALRQATVDAAAYLERPGEGVIAEAARADLLLVRGNPLEDVANVREIEGVMVGGRWFSDSSLKQRLAARQAAWEPIEQPMARAEQAVSNNSPEAAVAIYLDIAESHPQFEEDVESLVNRIGYDLLGRGRYDAAIDVFERNRDAFPQSANTYDSLAEAHLERGNRETAVRLYRQALEVDPGFSNAARMLKQLEGGTE